jgi:hypothetical protein
LQALRAFIPLTVYGPVVWWKPFGEATFPLLALMSLAQVDALLAAWDGATRTIIGGDFNATPDSAEFARLTDAGLVSG